MRRSIFSFFLLAMGAMGIIAGCSQPESKGAHPEKESGWQLVKEVSGHHDKITDRFKLNGNKLAVEYEVESGDHYTHSKFDLQIGTGAETNWKQPDLEIFNQDHKKGKIVLSKGEGTFLANIHALNVHYHLKIYQKSTSEEH